MARIEVEIKSKFKNEQQKAMINIMFTANWLKNLNSNHLKPFGLSTEQYNILRILNGSSEDRMKMHSVRDRMIDRSPNTTRLIDRLLEKGAIERERCTVDRRVVFVKITDRGRKLLAEVDNELSSFFEGIAKGLSNKNAESLNKLIEEFRANLETTSSVR